MNPLTCQAAAHAASDQLAASAVRRRAGRVACWDPRPAEVMARAGEVVYEEAMLDLLVADLSRPT